MLKRNIIFTTLAVILTPFLSFSVEPLKQVVPAGMTCQQIKYDNQVASTVCSNNNHQTGNKVTNSITISAVCEPNYPVIDTGSSSNTSKVSQTEIVMPGQSTELKVECPINSKLINESGKIA